MKLLVVFHPTPYCNLDCSYCWAPDRDIKSQMPLSVVEEAIKQVYSIPNISQVDFCWLTGEPLIMGLKYYQAVIDLCSDLKPSFLQINFIIQSNGTLIDDNWALFFKKHDFVVGVSIDGPKELHDEQRKNKSGKSTFDQTLKGIALLVKHEVKGGALCVITPKTLEYSPDKLFNFFQNRKIGWSYLIEAKIGENDNSKIAFSKEHLPKLKMFLERLMQLWGEYPDSYIKDFDTLSKRLFGNSSGEFEYDNLGCLDIINIIDNGDYYWGNPELMKAMKNELRELKPNLFSSNLYEFRNNIEFKKYKSAIYSGIQKCVTECEYFRSCRGGNPSHKYYEYKRFDVSSHLTCELNDKVIAELLLSHLNKESTDYSI
jgi:uncharacterized protein